MEDFKNKELKVSRLFNTQTDLMWHVWTTPDHIKNWWGPHGFTNIIHKMDFQVGGEWKFTMIGPDGINYPNRSIYKEIIPLQKIVFEHFNPHFITTILFTPMNEKTFLQWTSIFDSDEMFEIIIKAHQAEERLNQNIEKLDNYLSKIQP